MAQWLARQELHAARLPQRGFGFKVLWLLCLESRALQGCCTWKERNKLMTCEELLDKRQASPDHTYIQHPDGLSSVCPSKRPLNLRHRTDTAEAGAVLIFLGTSQRKTIL